mgnify:CR=1 FL=1
MGRRPRRKMEYRLETKTMKLTTKILKEMIAQELGTMKETEEVTEEQEVSEGMENITPESIMMVIDALQQMGVELSPALAGGGLMGVAMKAKDMLSGKEVMDDPQYYNDEEEVEEGIGKLGKYVRDRIMGPETEKDKKEAEARQQIRNDQKTQTPSSSMKLRGPFEEDKK